MLPYAMPAYHAGVVLSVKVQSTVFWVSCAPWLKSPVSACTSAHSKPGSWIRRITGLPNV